MSSRPPRVRFFGVIIFLIYHPLFIIAIHPLFTKQEEYVEKLNCTVILDSEARNTECYAVVQRGKRAHDAAAHDESDRCVDDGSGILHVL